jgi:hypothetical protein
MSKLGTVGSFPEKAEEVLAKIFKGCWLCRFLVRSYNTEYLAKCFELEYEMGKKAGLMEAAKAMGIK